MGSEYELAAYGREPLVYTQERLLAAPGRGAAPARMGEGKP
jgi:formate hydrogenlyase subunit 6/NADH:ubiquinone oxidoreductase subunit I